MAKAKKTKNEDEIRQEIIKYRKLAGEVIDFLDGKGEEEPDRVLTFALGIVLGAKYPQEEAWKITTDFVFDTARHTREIINAKMSETNAEA